MRERAIAGRRLPSLMECPLDISDGLSLDLHLHIVPVRAVPQGMALRIPAVAPERRQVHTADKGDLTIHDDHLLMVAVSEMRAFVERALDIAGGFLFDEVPHILHRSLRRLHDSGGTAPQEHAHGDALRCLSEEIEQLGLY